MRSHMLSAFISGHLRSGEQHYLQSSRHVPLSTVTHSIHLLEPDVNAFSSLLTECSLISVLLEPWYQLYCVIYHGLAVIS